MMTAHTLNGRARTTDVPNAPGLPRPARYDKARTAKARTAKARTAKARTTRGRGRKSVPLVIDGITHYSTAEAAERLGLALSTVKGAIATGALAYRAVGPRKNMVPEPALEEYRRAHLGRRGRPKGRKTPPAPPLTDTPPATSKERD